MATKSKGIELQHVVRVAGAAALIFGALAVAFIAWSVTGALTGESIGTTVALAMTVVAADAVYWILWWLLHGLQEATDDASQSDS